MFRYSRAVSLLGVTDVALIDDMVDALSTDDAGTVFGTVEKVTEAGHDPRRFATDLLDRLRDLVLLRAVPESAGGLVSAPEEELSRMVAQSERLGLGTLSRYADIVHNGLLEMRGATSPRLVLELLCARMLLPSVTEAEKALLARIERLERRATLAGGGGAPAEGRRRAAGAGGAGEGVLTAFAACGVGGSGSGRGSRAAAGRTGSGGEARRRWQCGGGSGFGRRPGPVRGWRLGSLAHLGWWHACRGCRRHGFGWRHACRGFGR